MGYILYLINEPGLRSAEAAEAFVEAARTQAPQPHPAFQQFVQRISERYPDLSEDDEDGDDPANLWEEGLDDRVSYGAVKELVVKIEITLEALQELVQVAHGLNLRVYDEEGQVLYTPENMPESGAL